MPKTWYIWSHYLIHCSKQSWWWHVRISRWVVVMNFDLEQVTKNQTLLLPKKNIFSSHSPLAWWALMIHILSTSYSIFVKVSCIENSRFVSSSYFVQPSHSLPLSLSLLSFSLPVWNSGLTFVSLTLLFFAVFLLFFPGLFFVPSFAARSFSLPPSWPSFTFTFSSFLSLIKLFFLQCGSYRRRKIRASVFFHESLSRPWTGADSGSKWPIIMTFVPSFSRFSSSSSPPSFIFSASGSFYTKHTHTSTVSFSSSDSAFLSSLRIWTSYLSYCLSALS